MVRRNPRVVSKRLAEGKGAVLLHLDTTAYHSVNEVGAAIWEILEEPSSLRALLDDLRRGFPDAPAELSRDVGAFVDDLLERELLLEGGDEPS